MNKNKFDNLNIPNASTTHISFYVDWHVFTREINKKMNEILQENNLNIGFNINEEGSQPELVFDYDAPQEVIDKLSEIGISYDTGYEALCEVAAFIYGMPVDIDLEIERDGVYIFVFGIGTYIMNELDRIANSIDDMSREETKGEISKLFVDLKRKLYWNPTNRGE